MDWTVRGAMALQSACQQWGLGGSYRRCDPLGACIGLGGNQDGEQDICFTHKGLIIGDIGHPGLCGQGRCPSTSTLQVGEDAQAVLP
jgi:hypothetical protein